jgi:hypothetical protein
MEFGGLKASRPRNASGYLGHVVYESRGDTFAPDALESGTLGVLVDRYGDPTEGAPEMLAVARVWGGTRP